MIVRDIRPDGTVLRQWITPADMELYLPPDVIHGEPLGPWERQYGVAGEDRWTTVFRVPPESTTWEPLGVSPISHAVQQTADDDRAERSGRHLRRVGWIIIAIVVIVFYIGAHNARYQHCAVPPGLFSWPDVCI